jgi:hypothetical protein
MVWIFKNAAVEPRGIQARPHAMTQLIITALTGILRLGETWRTLQHFSDKNNGRSLHMTPKQRKVNLRP